MAANREDVPLLPQDVRVQTVYVGGDNPSETPSTRQVQTKQRPAQEIHPLPWFRSPELSMNKEKARLNLKRKQQALKQPERWTCSRYFASLGNGEKCVHILVLVILIATIVVILSVIFAPEEGETRRRLLRFQINC
ncbi:hypothetical protein THRCLA_22811 [Thraustotheca clavata]|uniref:Uncharacterized protein n=1 Tax=Thraustotheca clavata TaxID=74557 RepID=A0A1V9YSU9_9STRA|nr:hypothetical protein THRCLA_22811 [Thraustotheca clavata]